MMASPAIPNFDDYAPKKVAASTVKVTGSVPNFDDYAPPASPAQDKPASNGFLGSLWDEIKSGPANLLGVGNSINQFVAHPINTLSGMGQGTVDLASKTADSFKHGDYVKGARRALNTGINAVIPGLGTSSEDAGDTFDRGDIAGGLGKTVGIGVNTALGAKAPKIMEGAANLPNTVRGLTKANPTTAITRAYRPTPSDPSFTDRIPQTLEIVKEANGGVAPKGNAEVLPAIDKAITQHQSTLDSWFQRAKGIRISGGPIVDATRQATQGMLPSESGSADALIGRAVQDYGGDFTPEQLKARLELLNKRLDPFYSKNPGKQSSALADIPDAVLKAQRDATADALYRALDPDGGGMGPRQIQRQIGDMIELKDSALRRKNAIIAEQPVSPLGKVGDAFARVPRAMIPSKTGLSFSDSMQGKSDPLIRRAFDAVGKPNVAPRPGSALYPVGDPTKMLGSGDIVTPPPVDQSYVRSAAPAPHQQVNRMRPALPPGTAPFTQGTSVPDIPGRPDLSAARGNGESGSGYRRGLIEAGPQPNIGGPQVQGSGVGSGNQRGTVINLPYEDKSFVRSVPASINPATGKPWTPEELAQYPLPRYARGGVIKHPTLLSDLATGTPTGIMAEAGPEAITPLATPPHAAVTPSSVRLHPHVARSAKQRGAIFEAMRHKGTPPPVRFR